MKRKELDVEALQWYKTHWSKTGYCFELKRRGDSDNPKSIARVQSKKDQAFNDGYHYAVFDPKENFGGSQLFGYGASLMSAVALSESALHPISFGHKRKLTFDRSVFAGQK